MPVTSSIGFRSGFTNLPPRVILRDRDSALGRYPTIARTGDPDFLGKFPVHFDDTRTLIFSTSNFNETLIYPGLLNFKMTVSGSDPIIATPNITSSISISRHMVAGISDDLFDINQNNVVSQSLSPFNESRIYLSGSEFYLTGTSPSIIPGFSSQLRDKTVLTIKSTPNSEYKVAFSTGTSPHSSPYATSNAGFAAGINSGLTYYNWKESQWEPVGNLRSGSNVDYWNERSVVSGGLEVFTSSLLTCVPAQKTLAATTNYSPPRNTYGIPVNTCGFPLATKFNATGSQLLDMSTRLTHPFLVEKIVLEISGAFGGPAFQKISGKLTDNIAVSTFILMKQSLSAVSSSEETTVAYYDYGTHRLKTGAAFFSTLRERDIIWFGRVAGFRTNSFNSSTALSSSHPEYWESADHWLPMTNSTTSYTGSIRLEAPVRRVALGNIQSDLFGNRSNLAQGISHLVGNPLGGSNLFDLTSGRRYARATVGGKVTGKYVLTSSMYEQKYEDGQEISPFVLMPKDKLILAAVKQLVPSGANGSTEFEVANRDVLRLAPSQMKMTFFGSLIKNSTEYHQVSNQPLTSDAIHEALHSDNPVVDQFEVESFKSFAGSFNDQIFDGSMFARGINFATDPIAKGARGVVGSMTEGTQGTTGSLFRGVRVIENTSFYFDSFVPNPMEAYLGKGADNRSGKVIRIYGYNSLLVGISHVSQSARPAPTSHAEAYDNYASSDWADRAASPYAAFSDIHRVRTMTPDLFVGPFAPTASYIAGPRYAWPASGTVARAKAFAITGTENFSRPAGSASRPALLVNKAGQIVVPSPSDFVRLLYGRGDGDRNTVFGVPITSSEVGLPFEGDVFQELPLRGFGYGLKSIFPHSPSMIFRRSKYGQLRDMLEQRKDSKFYDDGLTGDKIGTAPINIKFVDANDNVVGALDTSSQNISQFATSSLPYHDGIPRDRPAAGSDVITIDVT